MSDTVFVRDNKLYQSLEIEMGYFTTDGLFCLSNDYTEFTPETLRVILDKLEENKHDRS